MKKLKNILSLYLVVISMTAYSQSNLEWWNYTGSNSTNTSNFFSDGNQQILFDGSRTWVTSSAGLTLYENNEFVKNYNGSDSGLTSNQINCINIDSEGSLWLGTYCGGLVKYKPSQDEWVHYFSMPSGKNLVSIKSIKIDENDTIYLLCRLSDNNKDKLVKFNGLSEWEEITPPIGWEYYFFSTISIDSENRLWAGLKVDTANVYEYAIGLLENDVWTIFNETDIGVVNKGFTELNHDSQGNLWVLRSSDSFDDTDKLIRYNGISWDSYEMPVEDAFNVCHYSFIDSEDNLWFCLYDNRILKFDVLGNWSFFDLSDLDLNGEYAFYINIDTDGNWWFLYLIENELYTYYYNGTMASKMILGNSGLTSNLVYDVAVDSQLNAWIIHSQGLEKFEMEDTWTFHPPLLQDNSPYRQSLILDENQLPWYIGSDLNYPYYSSIIYWDGTQLQHEPFITPDSITPSHMKEIAFDLDWNLWSVYFNQDVAVKNNQTQVWEFYTDIEEPDTLNLDTPLFKDISINQLGEIWIAAGSDRLLYEFADNEWLPLISYEYDTEDIVVDNNSDVWVSRGHVPDFVYQYTDDYWIVHDITELNNDPASPSGFLYLHSDNENNLWGYGDRGLFKYDGIEWEWYNSLNSGLPCDRIHDLFIDHRGNIWLATICGLVVFNEDGLKGINPISNNINPIIAGIKYDIFPNPANDKIFVESINNKKSTTYKILDTTGQVLIVKESKEKKLEFDVTKLMSGIYFMQIQQEDYKLTKKFITLK